MIRQHQSIIHGFDPEGRRGDCFRTSVACVMGVDLEVVPHFSAYEEDPENLWFWAVQGFCHRFGWDAEWNWSPDHLTEGWSILAGTSPFGVPHSVVAYDNEIIWDPNPAGMGLVDVTGGWIMRQIDE